MRQRYQVSGYWVRGAGKWAFISVHREEASIKILLRKHVRILEFKVWLHAACWQTNDASLLRNVGTQNT